jgi:predicted acyltransferase
MRMPIATRQRAGSVGAKSTARIPALDALRGLAIVLMILVNNPGDRDAMPAQFVHSPWHGFWVAETVFPMFLFAVGVSMALSRRVAAPWPMLRRAALLVLIGCVLVSVKYRHPAPSTGTLQLIAGASLLAWAARRWLSRRAQVAAAVGVLGALWIGFTVTGWAPRTNLAARVDSTFLGSPSDLGLVAIVSASTIVLAATWLGDSLRLAPTARIRAAVAGLAGAVALTAGLLVSLAVPVNKRIWTPSYDLIGFGVAALVLAALLQWYGHRIRATRAGERDGVLHPLVTFGTNAIVVYVLTSLAATTILEPLQTPAVSAAAGVVGASAAAVGWALGIALLGYLVCLVLERRRVFVRL